jgi:VanZ family protein
MLPLRHPKVWLALGWLLVIGVITGSLVPGDKLPSLDVSDKLLHAGSYFLLMIWFAGLYRRAFHPLIGLVLLALGATLDLFQGMTVTRSFDPRDIVANSLGILAGLVLSVLLLEGWCQRLERRFAALAS